MRRLLTRFRVRALLLGFAANFPTAVKIGPFVQLADRMDSEPVIRMRTGAKEGRKAASYFTSLTSCTAISRALILMPE